MSTFVQIYHPLLPATSENPVWVALKAVDEHEANGWVLVDPGVTPPPPTLPYFTRAETLSQVQAGTGSLGGALRAAFVPFWKPNETVTAGTVRMTALGITIKRNTSGTTRASYDATEAALWTVTSGAGGGAAGQRAVDYLIYKSGSNYVAEPRTGSALSAVTNTNFSTVLQACIDALTPAGARGSGGGHIKLADGTFTMGNEAVITGWEGIAGNGGAPDSQLVISGNGHNTVLLQNTAGQNGLVVKNLASVVLRDFRMYSGASAKSCLLGDNTGAISEMSIWTGVIDNVQFASASTTAPAVYLKNFFNLHVPSAIIASSANHGLVIENDSATTNYGNSHFGLLACTGAAAAPFAALAVRTTNDAHFPNLLSFDNYSCNGGYYGLYAKGMKYSTFTFVDLENATKPVYFDGGSGYGSETRNNTISSGYIQPTSDGVGITTVAASGGNRVAATIALSGTTVPLVDQSQFRTPNRYDVGLPDAAALARVSVVDTANTELIARLGDGNVRRLYASAVPVGAAKNRSLPGYWVGAYAGLASGPLATLSAAYTSASTSVNGNQIALDCTDLRVVLPFGWSLISGATGGDAVAPNGIPCKVALQVGSAYYPVTFRGGQRLATADGGGALISDPIGGIWAKGTQVKTRILMGATNGQSYPNGHVTTGPGINPAFTNEGFAQNSDVVDSTANPASAVVTGLWRGALLGRPLAATPFVLGAIGDSIMDGTGDTGGNGYSWITRATNAQVPCFLYTRGGGAAAGYALNPWYSMPMMSGCSHIVVHLGPNDFGAARTVAQLKTDLSALYRMAAGEGAKVLGATITPRTSSTDSWATVGNQTTSGTANAAGSGSDRGQVNAWIRAGADGLIAGYIDTADVVETARDSGIWKAGLTGDGLHPNSAGHAAMAAAVNLTAIAAL